MSAHTGVGVPVPHPIPNLFSHVDFYSNLSRATGGAKLRQLRDTVSKDLALRDAKTYTPKCYVVSQGVSNVADQVVEIHGANFLPRGRDFLAAKSWMKIVESADGLDYIRVESILPGKDVGDLIAITVAAPDGAGSVAVDSLANLTKPTVLITPKTGDEATTIAQIESSKLVRAEVVGNPANFVWSSKAETRLSGGQGGGVAVKLGVLDAQNNIVATTALGGTANGTSVIEFGDDTIILAVAAADIAVGEAVPVGVTMEDNKSSLMLSLLFSDPGFELCIPLIVTDTP